MGRETFRKRGPGDFFAGYPRERMSLQLTKKSLMLSFGAIPFP